MRVSPHIVVGLHYGRVLGEANALDIVSRYPVEALVLVVVMPFYAAPASSTRADPAEVRPHLRRGAHGGCTSGRCCSAARDHRV